MEDLSSDFKRKAQLANSPQVPAKKFSGKAVEKPNRVHSETMQLHDRQPSLTTVRNLSMLSPFSLVKGGMQLTSLMLHEQNSDQVRMLSI